MNKASRPVKNIGSGRSRWPRLSFIADVWATAIDRVTRPYERKSKRFLGHFYLGRRTRPDLQRALQIQAGFVGRLTSAADYLYRAGTSEASSVTTFRALIYIYRQDSAVMWPRLPWQQELGRPFRHDLPLAGLKMQAGWRARTIYRAFLLFCNTLIRYKTPFRFEIGNNPDISRKLYSRHFVSHTEKKYIFNLKQHKSNVNFNLIWHQLEIHFKSKKVSVKSGPFMYICQSFKIKNISPLFQKLFSHIYLKWN